MKETKVTTQQELDNIPADFGGIIIVSGGSIYDRIHINKRYINSVEARENSSVIATENSSVEAWENSSVIARRNSSVIARGNSSVEARENSSVIARRNSSVIARENSSVEAWENSSVEAWENSSVIARGNSSVIARGNSSVIARENSSVIARGNSIIRAFSGKIECHGYNIIAINEAHRRYVQADVNDTSHLIVTPAFQANIDCYAKHFPTNIKDRIATLYKAVHKTSTGYWSHYNNTFSYVIGQSIENKCDPDILAECSYGIHGSHLSWALNFSGGWNDAAILEIAVPVDKIIVPQECDGKVRFSEATIIREVPQSEIKELLKKGF